MPHDIFVHVLVRWVLLHMITRMCTCMLPFMHADGSRIIPFLVRQVHEMLVKVANSLVDGGETGVFSPMHMLVFRKPAEGGAKSDAGAAASTAADGASKAADKASKTAGVGNKAAAKGKK